jgi:tetratricopeptide (TPR) repeat protein
MYDFDKLWNYNNPAETEQKFKTYFEEHGAGLNLSQRLQLLTQIARTYSLRHLFDNAHEVLNEVEKQLPASPDLARARYYLERGRTFNSAGNKADAQRHFEQALDIARQLHEDFYTIDAMHMLAIVAQPVPDLANNINEQAIILAENSTSEEAKNWLGSLYNNLAWGYFDKGEYDKALSLFLRALKWYEDRKSARNAFIAKWTIARTLRAQNKLDDALIIQLGLFEESSTTGHADGYVHEELGELYLLKNDALKAPFHFQKAYELLSQDKGLQKFESARLERIKMLSGQ